MQRAIIPWWGGLIMSIEDTHLWKDYYDGCEEEGWQDADPFDKDCQDIFDTYYDEGEVFGDDIYGDGPEEDNYDPDFFDERDTDDPVEKIAPAAGQRTRNIYIPIIDNNPRKPLHCCPKCHSNAAIQLKFISQPPKLDSSPFVHGFYFVIAVIFTLVALRSVVDIVAGIDITGNMVIIGVSGIIAWFSVRAYQYNKKLHEENCKAYQQQCELWAHGFRCTKCGTHYNRTDEDK